MATRRWVTGITRVGTVTGGTVTGDWVAWRKERADAALRLFCFPYAGGAALSYRSWADALPPSVEVCPVELPGRGTRIREPAIGEPGALLDAVHAGLEPWLTRPFAFFGHSMGGRLAYDLAQRLRARGGPGPQRLLLSACLPPGHAARGRSVRELSDERFVERLRRVGGTPPQVLEDVQLIGFLLPTLRADFLLAETLAARPGEPLDCPIAAFGGISDRTVPADLLDGWRPHTRASFSKRVFPGDHFYLVPARASLLAEIATQLAALPPSGGRTAAQR